MNFTLLYKSKIMKILPNIKSDNLNDYEIIHTQTAYNKNCGDYVKIGMTKNQKFYFDFDGCSILKISTFFLKEMIEYNDDHEKAMTTFKKFIHDEDINDEYIPEKMLELKEIFQSNTRYECIIVPYNALNKIIEEIDDQTRNK